MNALDTRRSLIDLTLYWRVFDLGQVRLYLTWTLDDKRPCLVLTPAMVVTHYDRVTPCIVRIGTAYLWDEHTGEGSHAAESSLSFANSLGFEVTPFVVFKITDIIREHLGDLLTCPPMPIMAQHEVGTATRRNRETGEVHETGIIEDV